MDAPQKQAGEGRNWPLTFRVTREERRLLRQAANGQRTSIAEILRQSGLQSMLDELSRGHA